jgi:hypothetical protein
MLQESAVALSTRLRFAGTLLGGQSSASFSTEGGASEVTKLGSLLSQYAGLVLGDELQLVTHDSGYMCFGYCDGLRNYGRFSPDHYVKQRCASHEFDNSI